MTLKNGGGLKMQVTIVQEQGLIFIVSEYDLTPDIDPDWDPRVGIDYFQYEDEQRTNEELDKDCFVDWEED
jgi:hypothetical protein